MGLFGIKTKKDIALEKLTADVKQMEVTAQFKAKAEARSRYYESGTWGQGYVVSFDGEKNAGEVGPVIKYQLNFKLLRLRSWQAYLTSDIAKTILNKYFIWIVDKGLKLQANPSNVLLKSEGIEVDLDKFNTSAEARFGIWSKSKRSSFNGMDSLKSIAKKTIKNAKIGGDVLVILRVVKGDLKVQLIDGANVSTPGDKLGDDSSRIIHGVEFDATGKQIAYHVRKEQFKHERVEAWSKTTGFRVAFLVYGSEFRLNDYRGVPIIATSLETLAKIDRYKEAAVGSAEERAKIVYTIEHGVTSTGEHPMADNLATMAGTESPEGIKGDPVDENGAQLAKTVAATTNKETFNLPKDSKLKSLESKQELSFKEFYGTNADGICSSVGIPPNVAFSIYNDSFSASRAATKDWEHTIEFERDDFQEQFYNPIYALWLHLEISKGNVIAPGYLTAFFTGDWMIMEAYGLSIFTGPMFPHIDPFKEARAERLKLGIKGKDIPLTTVGRATTVLMSGDSDHNMKQFAKELAEAKELGIITEDDVDD